MNAIFIEQLTTLLTILEKYPTISTKMLCAQTLLNLQQKFLTHFDDMTITFLSNDVDFFLMVSLNDMRSLINEAIGMLGQDQELVTAEELSDIVIPEDFTDTVAKISSLAPKNDKMAWWRLDRQMRGLLAKLDILNVDFFQYQEKIHTYSEQTTLEYKPVIDERQQVLDHIDQMRDKMVAECIHPTDSISWGKDGYVCKFCNAKLNLVK